jgi:hypothetical protein
MKSMPQAAATPVFCAVSKDLNNIEGGVYWNNLTQCKTSEDANDQILSYRLWEISESILISKTKSFDNTLLSGDRFSSVTSLSLPNDEEDMNLI